MVTLFGLLNLNKTSLFSTQYALQTINHNIANMNEAGYSRQDVLFRSNFPTVTPHGVLGNGVSVMTIKRSTAEFYTRQLRRETANLGGWDMVSSTLSEVESVLQEPNGSGLADAIHGFFEAWNNLSVDPENGSMRVAVVEAANRLTETFHSVDNALEQITDNLNNQISADVDKVNNIMKRISDINGQIVSVESKDVTANDLRDERDRLLMELSKIVKIDAKEDRFGSVDVYINGTNVVHRTEVSYLEVVNGSDSNDTSLLIKIDKGDDPLELESGELAGIVQARDRYMKEVRASLDHVASVLIDRVNELHRQGWTPQGSGYDFFEGDSAGTISVAYVIKNNPGLVATSYDGTVGDNSLANDIAALSEQAISEDDRRTINGLYDSVVAVVGTYSRTAKNMAANQQLICENLDTKRESIVGVNLDEEMVKLSQYQQSYQAAARMVKVVESLIQTVIDLPAGMY